MRLLSATDLSSLLKNLSQPQCARLLNALEESLRLFSSETATPNTEKLVHQPHRTVIEHNNNKNNNSTTLFMPSSNTKNTGVKVVTLSTRGARGVINIFSSEGECLGLLNAGQVTAFRTALATMTLFRRCGSLRKDHIVVFGSGPQAEWHARLALLLLPAGSIKHITFVNRSRKRLHDLERDVLIELREKYPTVSISTLAKDDAPAYEETLAAVTGSSDVIFCCTPSTQPLFPYSYLQGEASRQRFIALIGSYKPHMHEVDTPTLLSGGKVFVDSKEACMLESGELITAQVEESGLVEIGDVFARVDDSVDLEVRAGQNVVFKCVGMGIMDLVTGECLLGLASELGIGTDVSGF